MDDDLEGSRNASKVAPDAPTHEQICGLIAGSVSAEVVALDNETMMSEAATWNASALNVCIQVLLTADELKTCRL